MKKVLLVILVILVALIWAKASEPELASEYKLYIVKPCDTIWDISREITPKGRDIKDTMDEIREKNGLESGFVHAGQRIEIPVYEEK